TAGELTLENCPLDALRAAVDRLDAIGVDVQHESGDANRAKVRVGAGRNLQPCHITTQPHPGFPTDLQAQWTVLMTQATGNSEIVDTIYTDRFKHVPELRRLGANAFVIGNKVAVEGGTPLSSAVVMSTDLRASVSLVMAGLIAEGTTDVLRVYHLDRGYERLEAKLQAVGLAVTREEYDENAVEAELA
ncbi:MAG: UDP-N-acetylglucosamine 1-carboxyvinyltransferase, partial [Bacteroidota bacterium]